MRTRNVREYMLVLALCLVCYITDLIKTEGHYHPLFIKNFPGLTKLHMRIFFRIFRCDGIRLCGTVEVSKRTF